MKNRYIRIFMVFCTAFILILGNGCFLKSHKTLMLEYLEDKYGEEFEPLSYAGESWAYSYDKLSAHPKGKEDQIFNIQGCKNKEGKYVCHDNYFYYIIRDEYEQAMSDIVGKYFTEFKLYMLRGDEMYDDRLNYGVKVEDIYDISSRFASQILIFVKQNTDTNNIEMVAKKNASEMIDKKLPGKIRCYSIYDNKFDLVNRNEINNMLNNIKEWSDDKYEIRVTGALKILEYKKYD
ncbi:MAG: hypothetical protein PHG06_10155 [Parabacteroides sp.]|nr:hypothetical protein [Parabacteroides sp.]